MTYLYTHSSQGAATATGLSTQILIQVDGAPVGAIQSFGARQRRSLKRVTEVGTDGVIEIVPTSATEVDLDVDRIYFDKKRLPEAFQRGFMNIHSQRIPFDIFVYDFMNAQSNTTPANTPWQGIANPADAFDAGLKAEGVVTHVYENCWFASLDIKYQTSEYIISESASIQCEFVHTFADGNANQNASKGTPVFDDALERIADTGRRGSLDGRGLGALSDLLDRP